MRRRRFLWLTFVAIACLLVYLSGGTQVMDGRFQQRKVLDTEVPEGTVFEDLSSSNEWDIEATLRILPDPESPKDGIAAVKLLLTSKTSVTLRNIQATVWLPEGVRSLTPLNVIGTNLELFSWDLTPEKPKLGVLSRIHFTNFEHRERIIVAFQGPTLIKIHWDGGERYLQFPASHWTTEVVTELPEQSN